uniref:Uncharacterized protein n=1 Tax=Arundo donax TaxID=35708 RepID=A0A0A8ZG51_ARUDO
MAAFISFILCLILTISVVLSKDKASFSRLRIRFCRFLLFSCFGV